MILMITGLSADEYPPKGWVTRIEEAYRLAQEDDKNILINFTGSDWCQWCLRLREEVFTQQEFLDYAEEHLVLLFVDSPAAVQQSQDQISHNQQLQALLGVRGFPTLWLLDKDLNPLLYTSGYQRGGAEFYIDFLERQRSGFTPSQQKSVREALSSWVE
jgi:protein disulfide-isomerase